LQKIPHIFVFYKAQKYKTVNLLITTPVILYVVTHLKFSAANYSMQLCDITAYELPTQQSKYINNNDKINTIKKNSVTQIIIIYNLNSYSTQSRIYLFAQNILNVVYSKYLSLQTTVDSITELFFAANWLERELAELYGIDFNGKKDVRNLMLQYGDSSIPLKKLFPTIGLKEMVYDIIRDTLVQINVNLQA